jgi:hypothetical protein
MMTGRIALTSVRAFGIKKVGRRRGLIRSNEKAMNLAVEIPDDYAFVKTRLFRLSCVIMNGYPHHV